MHFTSEAETIARAAAGNQLAFRKLVDTHQGFIYSVAFRFLRDEAEAEDLTQETFIRFWKNISRYNPEYKLKTWLGKIVTNLALDHLKSSHKKIEKKRLEMHNELDVKSYFNPEKELNANQLTELIWKLSEKLTNKQRAVFVLRDLEQLEVADVCSMLDMQAGQIKSNLYYARLHMKEALLKYYKV